MIDEIDNHRRPPHRTCRAPKLAPVDPAELGLEPETLAMVERYTASQCRKAAIESLSVVLGRLERVNATGAALVYLLRFTGESQEELAERLGISKQAISKQVNALKPHFFDMTLSD